MPQNHADNSFARRLLAVVVLFSLLAMVMAVAAGCQSEIKGGETLHSIETHSITQPMKVAINPETGRVEYRYGGVEQGGLERISTTQPSVKGTGTLGVGDSPGEGLLGSASFQPIVEKFKNSWKLGLVFLVLGGGLCYPFHRYLLGGAILGLGCIVILNPALFEGLLIVAGAAVLIANWRTIKELTRGNQKLLEQTPPGAVDTIKEVLRSTQSPSTQAAVKSAK